MRKSGCKNKRLTELTVLFHKRVLDAMKLGTCGFKFDMDRFIEFDDKIRLSVLQRLGKEADTEFQPSCRDGSFDVKCKGEHQEMYELAGLAWPWPTSPDTQIIADFEVCLGGMVGKRMVEAVVFHHLHCPPDMSARPVGVTSNR